jgi:Trk-type K+ transport system membrane component
MHTLSLGRLVLTTFLITIGIGTLLLWLLEQGISNISLINAAFMATSATTVTGLTPIPFESLSPQSAGLIALLIQIGGLGVVTLSLFVMSLFFPLGLGTQRVAGEIFELSDWRFGRNLIIFSGITTLVIELVSTALFWTALGDTHNGIARLGYAGFHAISTFCCAGISIFPEGLSHYRGNILFIATTILVMLLSTVGFIVLFELHRALKNPWHGRHAHLSLHTRLVCTITAISIIGASLLFVVLDSDLLFADNTSSGSILDIVFSACSYRGVGFSLVSLSSLTNASLILIMALSFIGGSPTSTGSGIKTTVFTIVLGAIRAVVIGQYTIQIRGREIPNDQVFKAMAIFALNLLSIGITAFALAITEPGSPLGALFFESLSACCNLGLTLDLTENLATSSKIILIISMIIGRIGSLGIILALRKQSERPITYHYPQERILIG